MIKRYAVTLYSIVNGDTVWIVFPVNTEMTKHQLKTYYECKSLSISKVSVYEKP